MCVNFISSKDTEETRTIYVRSDNKNIMQANETNNIIEELFNSFLNNYQKEEQIIKGSDKEINKEIIKGSDFILENVELLDYHLHKVSLKRGGQT